MSDVDFSDWDESEWRPSGVSDYATPAAELRAMIRAAPADPSGEVLKDVASRHVAAATREMCDTHLLRAKFDDDYAVDREDVRVYPAEHYM